MARMLRSDVKSIKNEPQYKLVIATDELIGKICKTKRIDVIAVREGSFEEVEEALKEHLRNNSGLKPGVVMQAGSTNIGLKYWGLNPGLIMNREVVIRRDIVSSLLEMMVNLQKQIRELGGFIVFASLVPKPNEQLINRNDSKKSIKCKKVINEIFNVVNSEIWKLNQAEGFTTPNIKSYVQKTGSKERGKPTLITKRIKFQSPDKEIPRVQEQEKMMECCSRALEHATQVHADRSKTSVTVPVVKQLD